MAKKNTAGEHVLASPFLSHCNSTTLDLTSPSQAWSTHMVVDVDAVELVGRDGGLDHWGVPVSAETDPADLSFRPKLFRYFHAAAVSQNPVELLHGVDAMEREYVHVLHLTHLMQTKMCRVTLLL